MADSPLTNKAKTSRSRGDRRAVRISCERIDLKGFLLDMAMSEIRQKAGSDFGKITLNDIFN